MPKIGVRIDADELRSLTQGVEECRDLSAAHRA